MPKIIKKVCYETSADAPSKRSSRKAPTQDDFKGWKLISWSKIQIGQRLRYMRKVGSKWIPRWGGIVIYKGKVFIRFNNTVKVGASWAKSWTVSKIDSKFYAKTT